MSDELDMEKSSGTPEEEIQKKKEAAKKKAEAALKAKQAAEVKKEEPVEEPSFNQPLLDRFVAILTKEVGQDAIEEASINRLGKHVPTIVVQKEQYYHVCEVLKRHEDLHFEYVSELHGTDFMTYMEVYVYLFSFKHQHAIAVKVKTDREQPEVDSITPIYPGANWPEREAYDLLGITFRRHPDLRRILLSDDWVGYPLRKDYEPYDVEV